METYLSELVMDTKARQKIIETRGFCNNHFYKMLVMALKPATFDGHGMALIAQSVTEQLIQDLTKQTNHHKHSFQEMLASKEKCPAYIHTADYLQIYVQETASRLVQDKDFLEFFSNSKGLCVPHFIKLVSTLNSTNSQDQYCIEKIIDAEKKKLQQLNIDLAEYIKRQSYEYSEEDRSAVANTVLSSIKKISGRKGLLPAK